MFKRANPQFKCKTAAILVLPGNGEALPGSKDCLLFVYSSYDKHAVTWGAHTLGPQAGLGLGSGMSLC